MSDQPAAAEPEEVDATPVLAEARPLEPVRPSGPPPVVRAAAVAMTSFAAGAATVAVVRRHKARKAVGRRRRKRELRLTQIVASRSFLVDVHLLSPRD
jgi:hypothetical protein